jgi:hypothetical protein
MIDDDLQIERQASLKNLEVEKVCHRSGISNILTVDRSN